MKRFVPVFCVGLSLAALGACAGHSVSPPPITAQASHTAAEVRIAASASAAQKLFAVRSWANTVQTYQLNGSRSFPTMAWQAPVSGTVDAAGKIYVADRAGSNTVTTFLPGGAQTQPTIKQLRSPSAVAVDGNGNIYVANEGDASVRISTAQGAPLGSPLHGFDKPTGIAVDGSGKIYVTDAGSNSLKVLNADGTPNMTITDGIDDPRAVSVDPNGKIYVANKHTNAKEPLGKITTYDASGARSKPTITGLLEPVDVAVGARGLIYVTHEHSERTSSNGSVDVFNPNGSATHSIISVELLVGAFHAAKPLANGDVVIFTDSGVLKASPQSGFTPFHIRSYPSQVAIGPHGYAFVLTHNPTQIQIFDPMGNRSGSFTLPSDSIGGIAVDGSNNVYVTFPSEGVVRAYTDSGTKILGPVAVPNAQNLAGIAVCADKFYVVDDSQSGALTAFTLDGHLSTPAISSLHFPTLVTVSGNGTIYVGEDVVNPDVPDSSVLTFNQDGTPGATSIHHLSFPQGLAVDALGNIYVSDEGSVQVFSSSASPVRIDFSGLNSAGAIAIH